MNGDPYEITDTQYKWKNQSAKELQCATFCTKRKEEYIHVNAHLVQTQTQTNCLWEGRGNEQKGWGTGKRAEENGGKTNTSLSVQF